MTPSTWGALAGTAIAIVLLAITSAGLLSGEGTNYKVLVAVWLWLLPVTGVLAGIGYALGKVVEHRRPRPPAEEGVRGDAR